MELLQELLTLHEDAMVASKVRSLRAQLASIDRQLDTKVQAGETIDENHPLKKRQALLKQQIDQLNSSASASKVT